MNMAVIGRVAGLRIKAPLLALALLIMLLHCPGGHAETDIFPTYPCMAPNVDFWVRIYTEFESTQGVIHDKYRLDVIYEVIDLKAPGTAGSRTTNRQRIKNAKARYRAILTRLAQGARPRNETERRVQGLFGPQAAPGDFKAAAGHLRCQIGQKDRFRAGLIRSGAYIEAIKSIFRDSGLPEALAYLPHVESSYHPGARSKSGAVGIWQFTRATGGRYLQITPELDERWDPLAATHGAAALLRHNYRKFNSWPLAITAYNHGTAGVIQARRSKGDYEAIFSSYRSRRFRFASRNFYSEFLAASRVAENFGDYFGELDLEEPLRYQEVKLNGYVSLPRLIAHFRLNRSEVYRLNPALRPAVLKGHRYVPKGFYLRLPVEREAVYTAGLETLYRSYPARGNTHTVQRGDTAARIAGIHGVRLSELIAANALDARARIYPGQILKIPDSRVLPAGRRDMQSALTTKQTSAP